MNFKMRILPGLYSENQDPINFDYASDYPEMSCFDDNALNAYFMNLTKKIKVDDAINDWTLSIDITLGGAIEGKEIAIYKRGFTYPADKEKIIAIRISLPTSDEINWGIEKETRFDKYARRTTDKGFTVIPVDYSQFKNMTDYIENSVKLSLKHTLTDGITLKGQKIKL